MYITKDLLNQYSSKISQQQLSLFEQRNYSVHEKVSVFVSHKHGAGTDEDSLINQVVNMLAKCDAKAYIDWKDPNMQHITNRQTADDLKKKINDNDKFILIATEKAISSPWCNWELGIADLLKAENGKLAILPIADTSNKWNGNEYLQLYPTIRYYDGTQTYSNGTYIPKGFYFQSVNGYLTNLKTWLNK